MISSRQSGVGDVDSQRSKSIPVDSSPTTSLFVPSCPQQELVRLDWSRMAESDFLTSAPAVCLSAFRFRRLLLLLLLIRRRLLLRRLRGGGGIISGRGRLTLTSPSFSTNTNIFGQLRLIHIVIFLIGSVPFYTPSRTRR